MGEILRSAIDIVSRRRLEVALIVLGIQLPATLIAELPRLDPALGPLTWLGIAIGQLADVALIAVLLDELRGRPVQSLEVGRVLLAAVRALLAFALAVALVAVVMTPLLLVSLLVTMPFLSAAVTSDTAYRTAVAVITLPVLALILLAAAPLFLLIAPVCLTEPGWPWRVVRRSWTLARGWRKRLIALAFIYFVVGLPGAILSLTFGWFVALAWIPANLAAGAVFSAALAVIYLRLSVQREREARILHEPGIPARELAAAGTFREHARPHGQRKHRRH
jgi:hypothetical protein